jgi:hypothetical protein
MQLLSTEVGQYFAALRLEVLGGNRGFRITIGLHQYSPVHKEFARYADALALYKKGIEQLLALYTVREDMKNKHQEQLENIKSTTRAVMEELLTDASN